MGSLCKGGYSYRVGGSVGVGYVAWRAWQSWRKGVKGGDLGRNLVREVSSLQYRFATLNVITDV